MTKYYINWVDQLIIAKKISTGEGSMISAHVLYSDNPIFPANTRQDLLQSHWWTDFIIADSRAEKIKIIKWKFAK